MMKPIIAKMARDPSTEPTITPVRSGLFVPVGEDVDVDADVEDVGVAVGVAVVSDAVLFSNLLWGVEFTSEKESAIHARVNSVVKVNPHLMVQVRHAYNQTMLFVLQPH